MPTTNEPPFSPIINPMNTKGARSETIAKMVRGVCGLIENRVIQFSDRLVDDPKRWNTVIHYLEDHLEELGKPIGESNLK